MKLALVPCVLINAGSLMSTYAACQHTVQSQRLRNHTGLTLEGFSDGTQQHCSYENLSVFNIVLFFSVFLCVMRQSGLQDM